MITIVALVGICKLAGSINAADSAGIFPAGLFTLPGPVDALAVEAMDSKSVRVRTKIVHFMESPFQN